MVQSCCVLKCTNRRNKGCPISFHAFPWTDPDRVNLWINRISRVGRDGKPWHPTRNDKVCSAHFIQNDYYKSRSARMLLKEDSVPSIFPGYPKHKQCYPTPRRQPPKVRNFFKSSPKKQKPARRVRVNTVEQIAIDHTYAHVSLEAHLRKTQKALLKCEAKLQSTNQMLKNVNRRLERSVMGDDNE